MKTIVNIIQILVAVAIVFPVFHVWDTNNVAQLCRVVEPTMSKAKLLQLVDEHNVKIIGPRDVSTVGGKWQASIVSRSPFASKSCLVKGTGKLTAAARMVEN